MLTKKRRNQSRRLRSSQQSVTAQSPQFLKRIFKTEHGNLHLELRKRWVPEGGSDISNTALKVEHSS